MRIRIDNTVGDDAAALTANLGDWPAQERDVGPHTIIRRGRPVSATGAMSGEFVDWLDLAQSVGFSTGTLIVAYRAFRASFPPRLRYGTRLVVEHEGIRVVIEDGTAEDAARVARALAAPATTDPSTAPAPDPAGGGDGGGGDDAR